MGLFSWFTKAAPPGPAERVWATDAARWGGALLVRFVEVRLAALMEKLGLGPDEPIEHALVTASLAKARAKLAETVRNPREAASMEAWFDANVGRQEG
jgi:hypothetical protein